MKWTIMLQNLRFNTIHKNTQYMKWRNDAPYWIGNWEKEWSCWAKLSNIILIYICKVNNAKRNYKKEGFIISKRIIIYDKKDGYIIQLDNLKMRLNLNN